MAYSQNNEEAIILDYFKGHKGTFIDVGANDGVTFSNTRTLALLGWRGILIEPSPKAYAKLSEIYKGRNNGFYTYQYALSNKNGGALLYESGPLCTPSDVGLVSTFHQHEKERFQATVKYEPIEVKTFTWKTAMNRWMIKEFDFISLDVEGHELEILPDIDLSKTRMICLEWNSKPDLKVAYEKYLDGFKVIYTSAENLIYAR